MLRSRRSLENVSPRKSAKRSSELILRFYAIYYRAPTPFFYPPSTERTRQTITCLPDGWPRSLISPSSCPTTGCHPLLRQKKIPSVTLLMQKTFFNFFLF